MRTGRADLPLHTERAPSWLFEKMTALAREMILAIVALKRLAGLERAG